MGYKDKEKQKQAQHESYLRNKKKVNERSARNKKIYAKKNHTFIKRYKTMCGCSKCGYNEHFTALDFHHVDPDSKEFSIANACRNKQLPAIKDEIRKCVVLCANCHRIEHFKLK